MLLYLPERIYNVIKDDENYKIMAEKATKQIFGENDIDFLKIIYNYENSNEIIKELQNYIYKNTPEEYHLELKLSFSDDLSEFEKDFDKMDMETKLYWLCEMEDGNMSLTKDFNSRNMKFLRLYRNNVLPEKEKYSEFLHCMYYSKLIYEKIIECTEKEKNLNLVKDFFKYESKIFNEIVSFSDLEAFKHMMHSKREQMFVLFYEFIGQFCSEYMEVNNFIVKKLNNKNFKYNKYNYFKLMFYSLCFQQLIDKHQLNEAKLCLDNIIPLCLLNILYCSPFSHQSLEPCSISVYSCFGLDLNNPINAKTAYIIVKYKSVFPKYPIYAALNTLVIDVKLTISVNTFSKKISKSNVPL